MHTWHQKSRIPFLFYHYKGADVTVSATNRYGDEFRAIHLSQTDEMQRILLAAEERQKASKEQQKVNAAMTGLLKKAGRS